MLQSFVWSLIPIFCFSKYATISHFSLFQCFLYNHSQRLFSIFEVFLSNIILLCIIFSEWNPFLASYKFLSTDSKNSACFAVQHDTLSHKIWFCSIFDFVLLKLILRWPSSAQHNGNKPQHNRINMQHNEMSTTQWKQATTVAALNVSQMISSSLKWVILCQNKLPCELA